RLSGTARSTSRRRGGAPDQGGAGPHAITARAAADLRRAIAGGAAVLWAAAGLVGVAGGGADSLATAVRRADCRPPPAQLQRTFTDKDLGVQECPAPEDWRLLFVASHANSWLEVRRGDTVSWSGEDAIVYEQPIGLFPNVSGPLVEWRR